MTNSIIRTSEKIEVVASAITNQEEFYSTPEYQATGNKPLQGFDFICGYIVADRVFEVYRVERDGLVLFMEIKGGCSVIHDGPFYIVNHDQNGFTINKKHPMPPTREARTALSNLQAMQIKNGANAFAVTKDWI